MVPGRAFLRRLIDLTMGCSKPHHHIRLTRQAKLDLGVWLDFLTHFNGRSVVYGASEGAKLWGNLLHSDWSKFEMERSDWSYAYCR